MSLVAFRITPETGGDASVRTFKLMVRLHAGADASLETVTAGTALLYDRARFHADNDFRLTDGDRSVRFVGCDDEPAVFNGAILTTGPRSVAVEIVEGGQRQAVQIAAYE